MSTIYYKGIDTSKWQNSKVDYYKAKQSGIDFVFLRIGYNKTKDASFEKDYKAAVAAGLRVGAYFYTLATTIDEAKADATRVLGWLNDRYLDMPVVYDLEDSKQKQVSRKDVNSAMYNAFARVIEDAGVYDCMLYTGENYFNNYFNKASIKDDVWIAKYSSKEPYVNRIVSIWQYSSAAINESYYVGKLDRNYMLVDRMQCSKIKVEKIATNPYPEPTRLLKKTVPCMRGNDVKWLQWELWEAGILGMNDIDGIFGNKTKEALGQFQESTHTLLVDYKCGPATRYALKND